MAPLLHFTKRSMGEGATAGAAIGAAAAGILLIAAIVLFAVWYRRRHMPTVTTSSKSPHNRFSMFQWPSRSTIYVANDGDVEKAPPIPRGNIKRCGSCKRPQHAPSKPETARVRDRRGKGTAVSEPMTDEEAHWTEEIGKPLMNRPWMHMSGSRSSFSPSLSSKRATRMMMAM